MKALTDYPDVIEALAQAAWDVVELQDAPADPGSHPGEPDDFGAG
jgi:hypothetical protein